MASKHKLLIYSITLITMTSCTKAVIDETPPSTITETIFYTPHVEQIMTNNCISCHSGPAAKAGLDLTTYENVRFYAEQSNLIQRMNSANNPMPPSGLLSAEIRQMMDKWVEGGYLRN